jgi:hypothetical protein
VRRDGGYLSYTTAAKLSAHKLHNIQKIKNTENLSIQKTTFLPNHIQITQNSLEWKGEGGKGVGVS